MEDTILFKELKAEKNFWDAHTVGKNIFCKFPDNQNIFDEYFCFCCTVASYPIEMETRRFFLKEAELALSIYSERAEMSRDNLKFIEENVRLSLKPHMQSIKKLRKISIRQGQKLLKPIILI